MSFLSRRAINPTGRVCPNCVSALTSDTLVMESGNGQYEPYVTAPPPKTPYEARQQMLNRKDPLCPNCHLALPDGFLAEDSFIIGFFGPTSSSKSQLILAMINELVSGRNLSRFGYAFEVDEASREKYRQHYKLLSDQGKPIDFTLETVSVTVAATRTFTTRRGQVSKTVNLVFADAPGEDSRSASKMAETSAYLYAADIVFILVPPAAIPEFEELDIQEVAGQSAEERANFRKQSQESVAEIAQTIARELRRSQLARAGKPLPELCVILTKADLLLNREGLLPPEVLDTPTYRADDWESMIYAIQQDSQRLEYAAQQWGVTDLLASTRQAIFGTRTFHLIAALGVSHGENGVIPGKAQPFRVTDLLLRILNLLENRELSK
jgi:hypothetical protein